MKSKIVEAKEVVPKIVYPCLMQHRQSKLIVMFHTIRKGQVIYLGNCHGHDCGIGEYSTTWDMAGFAPFHDTIELSN